MKGYAFVAANACTYPKGSGVNQQQIVQIFFVFGAAATPHQAVKPTDW